MAQSKHACFPSVRPCLSKAICYMHPQFTQVNHQLKSATAVPAGSLLDGLDLEGRCIENSSEWEFPFKSSLERKHRGAWKCLHWDLRTITVYFWESVLEFQFQEVLPTFLLLDSTKCSRKCSYQPKCYQLPVSCMIVLFVALIAKFNNNTSRLKYFQLWR